MFTRVYFNSQQCYTIDEKHVHCGCIGPWCTPYITYFPTLPIWMEHCCVAVMSGFWEFPNTSFNIYMCIWIQEEQLNIIVYSIEIV